MNTKEFRLQQTIENIESFKALGEDIKHLIYQLEEDASRTSSCSWLDEIEKVDSIDELFTRITKLKKTLVSNKNIINKYTLKLAELKLTV